MAIRQKLMMIPFTLSCAAAATCGPGLAGAAPLKIFAVSDAVRVFEDGYKLPDRAPAKIRVFGLRNEVLSAQCVIEAQENVKNLTVAIGPLERSDGAAGVIPPDAIKWNFVESIFIEENTPKLRKGDLTRPAPAWFPDCLSLNRHVSLNKGSLKAVYLTISIPRDAEPGSYQCRIAATADGKTASLPLLLTVYPATLPDERHLMATEWYSSSRFKQHHAVDGMDSDRFWRILQVYAENMAEHRQNVFRVNMDLIESSRAADGRLHFDFSLFDRWAEVFWRTGRMDRLETGFVARFGEGGWSSREIVLRDFNVRDEKTGRTTRLPGEEFLPQFLPAFVKHLRSKGWLEKTLFHICDEPSDHNIMAWREASQFVHRYAPELRRIDAIETPHCLDRLEIWTPKLDHLATWWIAYEDAQRRGSELWFYTVGIFQKGALPNKTVDVPLIDSRLMHWLNYRYDLKGYLHWGFNAWTDDPVKAPGRHRGDGWQVYPRKDGLLNSLRWEQMRNGIQDYECLWLLENKLAQIRSTLGPRAARLIEPRRRGVEIASRVVRSFTDFSRDPAVLYAARRQAIEELIDLDVSPRIIVQTNPLERSAVANDCAIDVHGWAEPGTKLMVNGREAPVASDGLFLIETPPTAEGEIRVEAESGAGRKTLVRRFELLY